MFYGTSSHNVDGKGRLFIPTRFREDLGDCFMITKGVFEPTINLYPKYAWNVFTEKLEKLGAVTDLRIKRLFYAWTREAELDTQGRLLLPPDLRQAVGIEKIVFVAGVNDHIEVWDTVEWEKSQNVELDESLILRLKEMGL